MDIKRSHMKVLHAIVQSGNATMECVSDNFAAHFQTHGERFQARCLYASLLRQNVLEDVLERITAIYILRCGYTCQMSSFPFLHVFLQVGPRAAITNLPCALRWQPAQYMSSQYTSSLSSEHQQ
eukprot:jgi/Ulvmu1/12897/UM098_0085.1